MLVNLLLNWNTNLVTAKTEAMLFPIFGRGRVVPPAIGQQIRAGGDSGHGRVPDRPVFV